ncbi:MAG: S9 family peptidase [Rickettsiaceae bacterium]|nr:S9 family peptidase [Rickettsiaceae bacterium]
MKYYINLFPAIFICALGLLSSCSINKNMGLIPRKEIFRDPTIRSLILSPDGNFFSYKTSNKGVQTVCISDINNLNAKQCIKPFSKRGIRGSAFAYDNEHIIFSEDVDGSENTSTYLYNIKTKKQSVIFADKGCKSGLTMRSRKNPKVILLSSNRRSKKYFDIYKLDLSKEGEPKPELMYENNLYKGFIFDRSLNIRFASLVGKDGSKEIFKYQDGKFHRFMKLSPENMGAFSFIKFTEDENKIYIFDGRKTDTGYLKILDLTTGKSEVILPPRKGGMRVTAISPITKKIQLVRVNYDKPKDIVLDDAIKPDLEFLKSVHEGVFNIHSRSVDDKKWIVKYWSDTNFGKYYLYDRENKKIKFIYELLPTLSKYKLSPMQPVIIKSRDGLDLVSYLTMPLKENGPKPMVLHVHGGPNSRVIWGYSGLHQWLANRGYAVLDVNFRGSTGLGKAFLNAGNRQWGKKMHEDILDAANWAIENKIADPDKICIMGGSYGGYEVLVSLTMSPEIFACGVDLVGPSDLVSLLKNTPDYWKPTAGRLRHIVGDIETEKGRKELMQVSPINYAHQITKPLLIAQGANDPRVKQDQSEKITRLLRKNNIPVTYALYPDEGHGFVREQNRLSYYAIVEQFLARHLSGKAEKARNEIKKSSLILTDSSSE